MLQLKELPIHDRPREKLQSAGAAKLSDSELLAVLLGSGTKQADVLTVARNALPIIDKSWQELSLDHLKDLPGFGTAKASLIVAALEFARRRISPSAHKIACSNDIIPLVQHWADRKQEHFVCISLNGAHEVMATRVLTIGLVNSTQVHPREVFSDPLKDRACAIIVAHNHPSGNVTPSEEDRRVTKILKDAGTLLGIKLLDHVIFTVGRHFSFADMGEL